MTLTLILLLAATIFSSCAPSGGGSSAAPTAGEVEAVLPELPKTGEAIQMPVGNDPVNLVYYTHTKTKAPINGWSSKTYTATGSCVVYNSYLFCWDDGLKSIVIPSGTYTYAYFGFELNGQGQVKSCYGGCTNDFFNPAPKAVTQSMQLSMSANPEIGKASTVLTSGTPKAVTCNLQGSLLNCVDFQIDLTQALY